jgi:hypothetical protein
MRPPVEPAGPRSAHVTGVGGGEVLAATYDDLEQLATTYAHAGLRLLGWAELPASTLVDGELLASAALAPMSFARVEETLLATLVGPEGLPVVAAEWEALAGAIVGAREVIEAADSGVVQRLATDTAEVLRVAAPSLPPTDRTELAIAGTAGLVATGLGDVGVRRLSRWISLFYGPETAVTTTPVPLHVTGDDHPPRDVADLARHLGALSDLSDATHPENDGTVEVQTLVGPDGVRRHVVYLPGTDDMDPLSRDGQLRDMQENARLVAGQGTAYAAGVLAALRHAGVRPGEPVLLTGHSQGGMVAAALAAKGSPYDVTNVVTFGSPTAQVAAYPAGVHVLSLEHDGDLVPQLAGPDAASPDQVIVRFDSGVEGVADNHSFEHYTAGAAAVDASTDPDVVADRDTLSGFLAPGQEVHSQVFRLTRSR